MEVRQMFPHQCNNSIPCVAALIRCRQPSATAGFNSAFRGNTCGGSVAKLRLPRLIHTAQGKRLRLECRVGRHCSSAAMHRCCCARYCQRPLAQFCSYRFSSFEDSRILVERLINLQKTIIKSMASQAGRSSKGNTCIEGEFEVAELPFLSSMIYITQLNIHLVELAAACANCCSSAVSK